MRADGVRGGCAGSCLGATDAATAADAGIAPPPVIVLDRGSVGPFDYVTISLDPSLPAPADAAVTWLMGNGYDVDATCSDPTSPTA